MVTTPTANPARAELMMEAKSRYAARRDAKQLPRSKAIVVGLSGRGDKDVQSVVEALR